MAREDDVRKIVSGARARGLGDEQIRALVARYDARQQESATAATETPTSSPDQRPFEQRVVGQPPDVVRQMALEEINRVAERDPIVRLGAAYAREGPQRVMTGLRSIIDPGATMDTRAGGLSDVARGIGVTVAPVALPAAIASAPIATAVGVPVSMATGYLAGRGAEAMGAGPGVTQLAEDVGGFLGGSAMAAARQPTMRLTQRRAAGLMGRVLKTNEAERAATLRATSAGLTPPDELGAKAVQLGFGKKGDIAGNAMRRFNEVEPILQQSATQINMPVSRPNDVADVLDDIAMSVKNIPFVRDRASEAARLGQLLRSGGANGSEVLKAKRLLDSLLNEGAFKSDSPLAPKREMVLRAANSLRADLHRTPLSAMLKQEEAALGAFQAAVKRSVSETNMPVVGGVPDTVTALATGQIFGAPGYIASPLIRRGVSESSTLGRFAQLLYGLGGGQVTPSPSSVTAAPVAGLLPPAVRPTGATIAMGPTPSPTGGRPALVPAAVMQKIQTNLYRPTQGMFDPAIVERIYSQMPARGTTARAVPDVVQGPGAVRLDAAQLRATVANLTEALQSAQPRDRENLWQALTAAQEALASLTR